MLSGNPVNDCLPRGCSGSCRSSTRNVSRFDTRLEIWRDVKLKRNVTAAIVAHLLPVDPNRTRVIDGAEVEQQIALVKLVRKFETSAHTKRLHGPTCR